MKCGRLVVPSMEAAPWRLPILPKRPAGQAVLLCKGNRTPLHGSSSGISSTLTLRKGISSTLRNGSSSISRKGSSSISRKGSSSISRKGSSSTLKLLRPVHATLSTGEGEAPAGVHSVRACSTQEAPGWLDAFHRFSRPHTVIGTTIGVVSVSLLAVRSPTDLSWTFCAGLLQALLPALLMNIYIVGLNQIYDVEIDKVNKPYLPLASGEFSLATGISIVVSSALLSLGAGAMVGSEPLLWALWVSLALGTAYSVQLPFLRWKRSAVAAASCILSVRAVVVQLAFYLHMQTSVLKRAWDVPWSLVFATGFMCFFSIVIALFKDIPDVEGDQTFGIQSFSVRLGQAKVFELCINLLQLAYGAAIVVCGLCTRSLWSKVAMVAGHALMGLLLRLNARHVDLSSKASISWFYMFIWKLFYAEYLLIPLMR